MSYTKEKAFKQAKEKYHQMLQQAVASCFDQILTCQTPEEEADQIEFYHRYWIRICRGVKPHECIELDQASFLQDFSTLYTRLLNEGKQIRQMHFDRLKAFYEQQYRTLPWWLKLMWPKDKYLRRVVPIVVKKSNILPDFQQAPPPPVKPGDGYQPLSDPQTPAPGHENSSMKILK